MIVVIRFPYVLKTEKRKEIMKEYTEKIKSGDCVLVSDPHVVVEVYRNFDKEKDICMEVFQVMEEKKDDD